MASTNMPVIPEDVLRDVFVVGLYLNISIPDFYLPDPTKYKPPPRDQKLKPALDPRRYLRLLCSVSSSWRAIARSTSELWTHINIVLDTSERIKDYAAFHFVETCLELSHRHPLDICISDFNEQGFQSLCYSIIPPLVQHIARWRSLDLHTSSTIIYANMGLIKGHLPHLRHLRVRGLLENVLAGDNFFDGLHSSELRTLEMPGYPFNLADIATRFPNVSNLCVGPGHNMHLHPFLNALSSLTSLKKLELNNTDVYLPVAEQEDFGNTTGAVAPFKLPLVEEIKIESLRGGRATLFFRYITCPQLHTVELGSTSLYYEVHTNVLKQIRVCQRDDNQYPSLRTLVLTAPELEKQELFSCIPASINLLVLLANSPSQALQWIMGEQKQSTGAVCEGLTSLALYNASDTPTHIPNLLEFVQLRGRRKAGAESSPGVRRAILTELIVRGFVITAKEKESLEEYIATLSIDASDPDSSTRKH